MKKVLLLLFTVLLSVVSCKKDNPFEGLGNPISKQKAMSIMKSTIDNSEDVGMYKVIIPADEPFDYNGYGAPGSATAPSYDSWLFLINTFWNTNDQRYIDYYFVNAKTGEIEHRQYGGPPVMNGVSTAFSRDNYECIKNPYGQLLTKSAGTDSIMQSVNPDPDSFYINSYAVIICGGINEYWNYFRYWMDCQFLYKTLKNYYGFTDSNIITLVCGGPSGNWYFYGNYYGYYYLDFDGDYINDIDYAASLSDIDDAFDELADVIYEGDNLLVFVTDHGGYDSQRNSSYIYLWGDERLYPEDFYYQLEKIDSEASIHVVMGQCHSGGFINSYPYSLTRVSISTACAEDEESHSTVGDGAYDEFLYHWTCAIAQHTPSNDSITGVDTNEDGRISLYEAYDYAQKQDRYNNPSSLTIRETPQYFSDPNDFGSHYDLLCNYSFLPGFTTSGTVVDVSYSHSATLYVTGIPSGVIPSFSVEGNLEILSSGSNYVTVRYTGLLPSDENCCVKVTITVDSVSYSGKQQCHGWRGGYYSNSNYISLSYGGNPAKFTLPSEFDHNLGFVWGCTVPSWTVLNQGYYFVYFDTDDISPQSTDTITVVFNNPLGETTSFSQNILVTGYGDDL